MPKRDLESILEEIRGGRLPVADGVRRILELRTIDLGFAKIDRNREARCGFPEVVLCEGKSEDEVLSIGREIVRHHRKLLATRAEPGVFERIRSEFENAGYNPRSRTLWVRLDPAPEPEGRVLILSAGTADAPVAEEAKLTVEMMDGAVVWIKDVGVAGLHRLLDRQAELFAASVIIVVAGMDGALPSVVSGLCDRPVIAVPTSVGYGAAFEGLAPLLAMLNSCASGVTVVNIDNGFGAGYAASLINRRGSRDRRGARSQAP